MSHRHSGKLLDLTLQMPPIGPYHYTLKQGRTVSHEGNHTKNGTHCQLCGNPLLLPAVVVLLTNDCRQIRVSSLEDRSESLNSTCLCVAASTRRFDPSRSVLLREDHEAGQIQLADCWGKWESAQRLSFMISLGVIPPQNECLYTRQWSSWSVELSWIGKCWASTIWYNCCRQRKASVLLFISTTFDPVAANALVLLGLCHSTSSLHC